jgi:hypothetical protein
LRLESLKEVRDTDFENQSFSNNFLLSPPLARLTVKTFAAASLQI